jgi:hypothetical protein
MSGVKQRTEGWLGFRLGYVRFFDVFEFPPPPPPSLLKQLKLISIRVKKACWVGKENI